MKMMTIPKMMKLKGLTPPLTKHQKTNEKLNNELQSIHQALLKIQQMIRPGGALWRVQCMFECVIHKSVMDTSFRLVTGSLVAVHVFS